MINYLSSILEFVEKIFAKNKIFPNYMHRDLLGNPINVGDYITYSAADGRSATLRIGQVIALKVVKSEYRDEVTYKVFAKSWSNFRSQSWNEKERSGRQKNVTLGFLDRILVIPASSISEKVRKDLAGPICDWSGNPIGD